MSVVNPLKKIPPKEYFETAKYRRLFAIGIVLKNFHRNNVNCLSFNVTLNKLRQNNGEFSSIEITSKKYTETTWKLVYIFFTYRRNIDIKLTLIPSIL